MSIGLHNGKVSNTESIIGTEGVDPNVLTTAVGSSKKKCYQHLLESEYNVEKSVLKQLSF
jgi:hypothetical protein